MLPCAVRNATCDTQGREGVAAGSTRDGHCDTGDAVGVLSVQLKAVATSSLSEIHAALAAAIAYCDSTRARVEALEASRAATDPERERRCHKDLDTDEAHCDESRRNSSHGVSDHGVHGSDNEFLKSHGGGADFDSAILASGRGYRCNTESNVVAPCNEARRNTACGEFVGEDREEDACSDSWLGDDSSDNCSDSRHAPAVLVGASFLSDEAISAPLQAANFLHERNVHRARTPHNRV